MFFYMCYLIHLRNDTDMKSRGTGRKKKTCLISTLSTVNPTETDLCSNPDFSNEKPVSNRLSHKFSKSVFSTGGLRVPFGS